MIPTPAAVVTLPSSPPEAKAEDDGQAPFIDLRVRFESADLERRYFRIHAQQETQTAEGLEVATDRLVQAVAQTGSSLRDERTRAVVENRVAEFRKRANVHQSRAEQYRAQLGAGEAM